jgi:hypothetical protein
MLDSDGSVHLETNGQTFIYLLQSLWTQQETLPRKHNTIGAEPRRSHDFNFAPVLLELGDGIGSKRDVASNFLHGLGVTHIDTVSCHFNMCHLGVMGIGELTLQLTVFVIAEVIEELEGRASDLFHPFKALFELAIVRRVTEWSRLDVSTFVGGREV